MYIWTNKIIYIFVYVYVYVFVHIDNIDLYVCMNICTDKNIYNCKYIIYFLKL